MKFCPRPPSAIALPCLCLAVLFSACTAPGDSGASDAAGIPSGGAASREETSSADPAVPVATGFVNLTRDQYSVLGCGSEQGYYEICYDDSNQANIYYIDYATRQEVYLCAAPNCSHDREGCTSWIDPEEGSYFPLVSGEHLLLVHITYGVEAPQRAIPHIDAANLDGSDRRTLVSFAANERLKTVFAANGSQLVCALDEVNPDDLEDTNATLKLVLIDLETGARTDFYEQPVEIGGTEPTFLGVTDNGYCVLREQFTAKSEADFPGQEWSDVVEEIQRSTQYTCTMIPVGSAQPAGTFSYSGRVYDLLCGDGLYYLDCDTRKVTRISLPDATAAELATLPDVGAQSAYLDGKLGDWFLLSQRYYETRSDVSYPVANDCCYAVNVQTGELRELTIRQEVGADRRMATMLGQTAADVLLITDSDVPETAAHYGYRYSLISREDYLSSNADALRPVSFLF